MIIGEKIKKLRKANGLTLEGLANFTNSSKSYIWELENKNIDPSFSKIKIISKRLGVTPDYFLSDESSRHEEVKSIDDAYYLQYLSFDEETKEKIRKITDCFNY